MVSYVGRFAPAVAVSLASERSSEPATVLTSSRSNTTSGDATTGVHHKPEHEPPVYRPELDSGFSTEHVRYTAEAAKRATALALDIISTCIRNPKAQTRDWAKNHEHVADMYETALQAL